MEEISKVNSNSNTDQSVAHKVGFTIPKIDLQKVNDERPLSHRDRLNSIDTSKTGNAACFQLV